MANITASTVLDACQQLALLADTTPIAGGTLTVNGVSLGSYDYVKKTGNQTVSSFLNSDWFTTTADSVSAFVIVIGDLTINSGQVFTPSNRKLFTTIYVTGNLIVNGQIAMDLRGANHGSSGSNIAAGDIKIINGTLSGVLNPTIPAVGAAGGTPPTFTNSNPGSNGLNGQTAGGGTGGNRSAASVGKGADGTSFSGGAASGGANQNSSSDASPNGGAGSAGVTTVPGSQAAGGGAGNPHGNTPGAGGTQPEDGTGGTLIIICLLTYSGSGTITSRGGNGGGGAGAGPSGGGGSGGGSITILCLVNSGPTPSALGGLGGPATSGTVSVPGAAGGNGYVAILLLDYLMAQAVL